MNELKTLTLLELRSLFGINKLLHTKDKKAKKRYVLLGAAWIIVILIVFSYVGGFVYGLCILNASETAPAYLVLISSLLILAFGIFQAGNMIFSRKGYDILSSMPIKQISVIIGKFTALYVEDLIFAAVAMLPGVFVYGYLMRPGILYYISAIVGTLFIPVIPLVISVVFGTVVLGISSGVKHKSLVQTLLTISFVVVVLAGSFSLGSFSEEMTTEIFASISQNIADMIGKIYLPALWLGNAMTYGSIDELLLFVGISLGIMIVTIYAVSKNYHRIMRRLFTSTAGHQYKIGKMESSSMLKALYLREVKRYFSSSIYVTNTIIGPIMGCMMSVALCVVGVDSMTDMMEIGIDISKILPLIVAGVFCMMTTTSSSISLEGKQFWVIQSLPIPAKIWLDSKILLNLSLMLPFYLVSEICLIIAVKPGILELVWMILLPALVMIFSAVLGITVNLKLHSFDWEKEEQVVKQSASAMFGGFAGMLAAILIGALVFIAPIQYEHVIKLILSAALIAVTGVMYGSNNKTQMQKL